MIVSHAARLTKPRLGDKRKHDGSLQLPRRRLPPEDRRAKRRRARAPPRARRAAARRAREGGLGALWGPVRPEGHLGHGGDHHDGGIVAASRARAARIGIDPPRARGGGRGAPRQVEHAGPRPLPRDRQQPHRRHEQPIRRDADRGREHGGRSGGGRDGDGGVRLGGRLRRVDPFARGVLRHRRDPARFGGVAVVERAVPPRASPSSSSPMHGDGVVKRETECCRAVMRAARALRADVGTPIEDCGPTRRGALRRPDDDRRGMAELRLRCRPASPDAGRRSRF